MAEYIPAGPWDENPELWDRLSVAGREFSGLATLDVDRSNKWQTKAAKGSHGAERTFGGVELAKVRIEYRVWTSEQYAELLDDLLPILEPDPTKGKRDAIAIGHAVATARKLTSITIDGIAGPKRAEPGIFALYIDATEQRPPESKNALGTAKGGSGKAQSPCQALEEQYRANRKAAAAAEAKAAELFKALDFAGAITEREKVFSLNASLRAIELQQQALNCLLFTPSGSGGSSP
jgi:hypothetical protein